MGGPAYIPHLLVTLLLQATLDNGWVVFVTLGGVERCRIQASPGARPADVHDWLTAEHSAGRLGPGFDRVDGVLPGGQLLSEAMPSETVAAAFGLRRMRVHGKRPRFAYTAN